MEKLIEALNKVAEELSDRDHDCLVLADKEDSEILSKVAQTLLSCSDQLRNCAKDLVECKKEASDPLTELVALANKYDHSGDPELIRQASVFDEILRTIGGRNQYEQAKKAAEKKLEELRDDHKEKEKDLYTTSKEEMDKYNRVDETRKAVKDQVRKYKPLEAALQTRTCPDHPGAQMARIAEHVFQCDLDKAIYNYQTGYETLKGNKVPGGDVSLQSAGVNGHLPDKVTFRTREMRLKEE